MTGARTSSGSPGSDPPHPRRGRPARRGALLAVVPALALLAALLVSSTGAPVADARTGHAPGLPAVLPHPAVPAAVVAPHAVAPLNNTTFEPTCYPINQTMCVSIAFPRTPDIIPAPGFHHATYMPNATDSIDLFIKSKLPATWTNAKSFGPLSPFAINVTGLLWNGDPYMSNYDGTTWHADGNVWWTQPAQYQHVNSTYPYWYQVAISNRSATGQPNFFSGETVTWWLYIVTNVSNVYSHFSTLPFTYTVAGAWAFSPHPGAAQFAGANASSGDLTIRQTPLQPNWNDSVNISIAVTAADVGNRTLIGSAYADVAEYAVGGALLDTATLSFPVALAGNAGAANVNITLSPRFSQVAGARIVYYIDATDTAKFETNEIRTPAQSYAVNGNGSFASGIFQDDLALKSRPAAVAVGGFPVPTLLPGQNLTLILSSRSPTTALLAAQVAYSFSYAELGIQTQASIAFHRLNSTSFAATIPGFPMGAWVNFSVLAWDFGLHYEQSGTYTFTVPTFGTFVPAVPGNLTFFDVYVFDNGTHQWVQGAAVTITSPSGFYNIATQTRFGVAYPNATGNDYLPLLLAANQTYAISVTDPGFRDPGSRTPTTVSVSVLAKSPMTDRQTLAWASNYVVIQEGSALFFWLNTTVSTLVFAPSVGATSVELASVIGLVASMVVAAFLLVWFRQIQARRKAEERRVTL